MAQAPSFRSSPSKPRDSPSSLVQWRKRQASAIYASSTSMLRSSPSPELCAVLENHLQLQDSIHLGSWGAGRVFLEAAKVFGELFGPVPSREAFEMGDSERAKGKQKAPKYEEFGEPSDGSARRTRARMTGNPGGEDGAGGNPSLLPLDLRDDRSRNWPRPQQQPAAQGGIEEGSLVDLSWMQDPEVIGSFMAAQPALDAAQHQESGGVGNPGTLMPPPQAVTPSSSSQMNFARDSTRQRSYATKAQLAATMVPQPRPQAPSRSQAQRSRRQEPDIGPICPRTHISDYLPQGRSRRLEPDIGPICPRTHISDYLPQGRAMRAPSSGAQRRGTSRDGASKRGLQVQARAPATAGQPGAATTGALGSGQPQTRANAGTVVQRPACHNNPRGDQCLVRGREPVPVNLAIDPRQLQPCPPPSPQQGLPAAPTNHAALVALQRYVMIGHHHVLQMRCPGCLNRPGLLAMRPPKHYCLCAFCRVSGVVCPNCTSGLVSSQHIAKASRFY